MDELPAPPIPPIRHGSTAHHFRDVPTATLVAEVRRLWDQPDDEADAARARGVRSAVASNLLVGEWADFDTLDSQANGDQGNR